MSTPEPPKPKLKTKSKPPSEEKVEIKVNEKPLNLEIPILEINEKQNSTNGFEEIDYPIKPENPNTGVPNTLPPDIVPASKTMGNLLDDAETLKLQIDKDKESLVKIIKKYGCNWVTLFYVADQYWSKIRSAWKSSKPALLIAAQKAKQEGGWGIEEEFKEPKVVTDYKDFSRRVALIKTAIKELEIAANQPNSIENNAVLREHSKALLEMTLECTMKGDAICQYHQIKGLSPNKETISNIERLLPIASKEEYSIIAVGLEKAGKSTFVNWLLGYDLLPMDEKRCTMVTTLVKYRNSSARLEVVVYFYDKDEFERNLSDLKRNDKEGNIAAREKEIRESFSKIVKKEEKITGAVNEVKQALHTWIAHEQRIFSVKKVEIFTNELFTSVPVEMIDVPGYDSTMESHRSMARDAIKSADAFIFVTAADRPNLTEPATILMQDIQRHGGYEIFKKGFGILTKVDNVEVESKGKNCIETAKEGLREFGIPDSHLFVGCPIRDLLEEKSKKTALEPKEKERLDEVTRKCARYKDIIVGGATKAKKSIFSYLINELPKVRAKEAKKLTEDLIKTFFDKLEARLKLSAGPQLTDAQVSKENDILHQFEKLFESSLEKANEVNWENNLEQRELKFNDIISSFQTSFDKSMSNGEAKSSDLPSLAKKKETYGLLMDVVRLAVDERDRLMRYILNTAATASLKISEEIYAMLQDLVHELIIGAGFRSVEDVADAFKLENIVNKDQCDASIHALVMRVAFPSAIGVLRWPYSYTSTRVSAIQEMKIACPEVEYSDEIEK